MGTLDQPPLKLRDEDAVNLGYVNDLYVLLRAIDVAFPKDATLYVEGTSIAAAISDFLRRHEALEAPAVQRGTVAPVPSVFHLPLSGSNLQELRVLAEGQAEPEVADHLVVYRGHEVLLCAYDAGANDLWLSRALPPEAVDRFRAALGDCLQESAAG